MQIVSIFFFSIRVQQIKANRERLVPIIERVILRGRQVMSRESICGYRDYGKID